MHKSKNIVLLLLVVIVMMACQSVSRPSDVLSADDFEDVLYDIHLSHYLDIDRPKGDTLSEGAHRYALMLSVLKKHGVTQAEWDSSMVYYTRHSPELKEIYTNLNERLSMVADGTTGDSSAGADSTDIWHAERHLMITSQRGYTTMQWKVDTDTLLKKGEKLNMEYLCLFLNAQAQKRMMTVLTIRLANDSVITRSQVSNQTGIYNIVIEDDKKIGIKSVSGYFMVMRQQNGILGGVEDARQVNSCQIISVKDIKLTHQAPPEPVEKEKIDV